jgi:hypothetical protein
MYSGRHDGSSPLDWDDGRLALVWKAPGRQRQAAQATGQCALVEKALGPECMTPLVAWGCERAKCMTVSVVTVSVAHAVP